MNTHNAREQDPLRETFVEMLFALAAAQVAISASALVSIPSEPLFRKLPAGAHLFVALILISTSWVGWRQSRSPGMTEKINSVFARPYWGLLLDVLLVILYFIVVQSAEIKLSDPPLLIWPPSAVPEAQGLIAIFIVYVIWDLLTDVFSSGAIPGTGWSLPRVWKAFRAGIVSIVPSGLSLILIGIVFFLARGIFAPWRVICLDFALVSVLFFFRAAKGLEKPLSEFFNVSDCEAFKNARAFTKSQINGGVFYSLGYILLLIVETQLDKAA